MNYEGMHQGSGIFPPLLCGRRLENGGAPRFGSRSHNPGLSLDERVRESSRRAAFGKPGCSFRGESPTLPAHSPLRSAPLEGGDKGSSPHAENALRRQHVQSGELDRGRWRWW